MKYIYALLLSLTMILLSVNAGAQSTWYTLASGDWDDADIWTLDPAGAVPVGSAVPSIGDNIVILSGKTITVPDGVSPYDLPSVRDVTLNCGAVTVLGSLDLRSSSGHIFSELNGSGRLLMSDDNYPTITDDSDFVNSGEGEGTVVFYGNTFNVLSSYQFCHLEINMNSGQIVSYSNDLTLNGSLIVADGTFQINDGGTTALSIDVLGSIDVQSGASFLVGTGNAFHWLNVYGDFTNEGSVDFTNSAQYVESTNGAVKVKFLGTTDNDFQCNGVTQLYRLLVDKGSDKTFKVNVTADNASNFSLYGPVDAAAYSGVDGTDGAAGWQRLPVVIENGTLELGSNIVINRLGENIDGSEPNEFSIPETARLWVNGATVTTGQTGVSHLQNWNGLSLYGHLKISAGSFSCPQYSAGISYYTPVSSSAVIDIEGGDVNIPQLVQIDNGATFVYRQAGGAVNFNVSAEKDHQHPTFEIPESNSVFEMSAGSIVFSEPKSFWDGDLELGISSDNYNITGGVVEVIANGSNFNLDSSIPFFNLTTSSGTGSSTVININNTGLEVLNDLTIGVSTVLNDGGYNISIGKDFNISGVFTQSGDLVFNGANNGAINNTTGSSVSLPGLHLNKDRHPTSGQYYTVSLTGSDNVAIEGNLKLTRGAFDIVNFDAQVTDSVIIADGDLTSSGSGELTLVGSVEQVLKGAIGKEQNFGNIILDNGNNGVALASDINVGNFTFASSGSAKVDLSTHNLTVNGIVSNYDASRYFLTTGSASDGALSLNVNLTGSNGSVLVFPIGVTAGYTPTTLEVQNSPVDTGIMTIKFCNSDHPTVASASDVIDFYWKVNYSGLSSVTTSDMRYIFTHYNSIANVPSGRGMVLQANDVWFDAGNDVRSGSDLDFDYGDPLSTDYTYGKNNAFNNIRTLYSRLDGGSFNNKNTWSETSHTGSRTNQAPASYDICIVGGASGVNHTINIDANNAAASKVIILGASDTGIAGTPPTLYVEHGYTGHSIDAINGNGRLVYDNSYNYYSNYTHITGDHTELCNSTEAIIEYTSSGSGPHLIPVDANIPYYPNLVVSESTGTTRTTNSMDLVVNGDLIAQSGTFFLDGNYDQYILVEGDVIIDSGTLTYENVGIRYMEIEGDISFTSNGTFNATGGTENYLYLKGNISVGAGTLDFGTSGALSIYYEGTENSTYSTGGNAAEFYRLVVNKGLGQKVNFISDFNLNGSTNGSTKTLQLISGEYHLNHSDIDLTLNTSTGGNDFKIPSGTTLRVDNGADISINGTNTGISLGGSLIIDNGGRALVSVGTGNYIQYDAGGNASIEVSNSGILNVGGQIRRSTNTDEGVLSFVQNGGVVSVGTESAPLDTRGMFEILGTGSSFTQGVGDVITIERSNGSSTIPSLYFSPSIVSYGAGAGFVFDGSGVSSETLGIYASQSLNDFSILGGTGNVAKLITISHTLEGNLSIGSGTSFDANGLDLVLSGNLMNDGTFNANNNTTYFVGDADQTISGSGTTTFEDVIKQTGTGSLILGRAITVSGDLTLASGGLNTATFDITVKGDLINDVTTLSTSGQGILLAGSDVQQIGGSGSYSILTINNSNGVVLPTQSGALNFSNKLRLVAGVFDIGRNLLVLSESASVEAVNPFSSSNMIQTNLSFTDNGIEKYFPVIAAPTVFVYPIGSLGKYTPITFNITTNGNNTGSIRVKAADEKHVSITDRVETAYDDTQNVLQYNWTLDADGIENLSASVIMKGDASDAIVTGGNLVSDYITARILLSSTDWSKFTSLDNYDESITELTFTFSGTNDLGIDGDYTAGIGDAIPDQIPSYITVADGLYSAVSTWATYDPDTGAKGSAGVGIPAGGPRGNIIYIDHVLNFDADFEEAYRTYINSGGTAYVVSTIGHRLGDVFGTGTLKLESGDVPAGAYDSFFSAAGGVLEYAGSLDYDVLSEIPNVNNVLFSGTGARRLPNIDVQLYGDLTLGGPDVENTHNTNVSIQGGLIFNAGTYDAGIEVGNAPSIIFNGSTLQTISGAVDFTSAGGGALYNFEIDNSSGVEINNDIEVENQLVLSDGVVYTDAGGSMKVTNALSSAISGGSASSYVQGALSKAINDNDNFTFPMGDQNRFMPLDVKTDGVEGGSETWEVQYYSQNPNDDGFLVDDAHLDGVAYVSHSEYWRVKSDVSTDAKITLNWDALSGVNPDDSDARMVEWTVADKWSLEAGSFSGTTSSGSVVSTSNITFNEHAEGNYFTFGTISIPAYSWEGDDLVDPTDWFIAENWSGGIVPAASSDITIGSGNPVEIDGIASVKSIWVNTGSLTLKPGTQLTIAEALTITDDGNALTDEMVIENSVASPSSLIVGGTVTGETTYKWDDMTKFSWWHIAHPVSDITETEYDNSFGVGRYALNTFIASGWSRVAGFSSDAAVYDFNADNEMEGYNLYPAEDLTLKYTGQLHNAGDYTRNFSGDQWWHVGNPYPSYIDVEEDGFDIGNFEQSVYIRRNDDQVSTYNILNNESLNEGSRYIAPGQCMWLKTTEATDAITIAKSTRTHSSDGYGLKSASLVQNDRIRLSLKSEYGTDESVVIFNSDGSELITAYDSEKMINKGTGTNLYSIKEGKSIAINSLPELKTSDVVSLGYQVDESGLSDFTLQATNIANFMPELDVFLKDKEEGIIVNLREEPAYTFTPSIVQADDRFELVFEATTTDAESDETVVSERNVQIFAVKQKAVVRVTDELLQSKNRLIEVYNLTGQLVAHHELNSPRTEFELPYADAIFIIKVSIDKFSYQEKIVVAN